MDVNDTNFETEVLQSTEPVLVDFWASWCPPCKMMEPVIDRLAGKVTGQARIVKLNIDRNPVTASLFKVSSVPCFISFRSGTPVARRTGALTENQLHALISEAANADAA